MRRALSLTGAVMTGHSHFVGKVQNTRADCVARGCVSSPILAPRAKAAFVSPDGRSFAAYCAGSASHTRRGRSADNFEHAGGDPMPF